MKYRWAAVVCAAVLGGIAMPARADVSALYEVAQSDEEFDDFEQAIDFAMTIEVNDAGNARIHLTGRSSYFLIRDDEVYSVRRGIDGPYAEKLDDLEAVIENAGETGGISLELLDQFPKIELVRKGKAASANGPAQVMHSAISTEPWGDPNWSCRKMKPWRKSARPSRGLPMGGSAP
ncbi:MAG: hypothetical protein R3D99_02210 [Altererythrobacter sp.]